MKLTYLGKVKEGKLDIADPYFDRELEKLNGRPVYVTVEEWRNTRSEQQNRYYWGVVVKLISEETGFDTMEAHEVLKHKFNPKHSELTNKTTGEIELIEYGGTTTRMTTKDFMEYIEKIQRWASEFLSLNIPDPNQEDFQ